jgi:predicted phosphoribosyltransferase
MRFHDRAAAGRALAAHLLDYRGRSDALVLALPRGGIVVGSEVARELALPLDAFVVRKLGVPGREELAMGAITSAGTRVLNEPVIAAYGISEQTIASIAESEGREVERRELAYRGGRAALDPRGRTIILVDDGLATGASMRVALLALRDRGPAKLVVGVPVAASAVCEQLRALADEVVCVDAMDSLRSIGEAYDDFAQVADDDVRALLAESLVRSSAPPGR